MTLHNNRIEGNRAGYDGSPLGLKVIVNGDRGPRESFTITNNTVGRAVAGPVMQFRNVKGATVIGNEQPLSSGELATFTGSTGVRYDG